MRNLLRCSVVGVLSCLFILNLGAQEVNALWTKLVLNSYQYEKKDNSLIVRSFSDGLLNVETFDPATGQSIVSNQVSLAKEETEFFTKSIFQTDTTTRSSPDGSLIAILTKKGAVIRNADTFEMVKSIAKVEKGKVQWYFLSNQVLLRLADKQAAVINVQDDTEKALTLSNQVNEIVVIKGTPFSYVVLDKSIIKLDSSTGEVVWESTDVSLFTSIFSNHLLAEFYQTKAYIMVVASDFQASSNALINSNIYLLNPDTGKLLMPAFRSKIYFTDFHQSFGDAVTDMGNGRLMISNYNTSVIDTNLGKEIYAHGGYSRLSALADNLYVRFEADGKFQSFDITTRKAVKKYNLGIDLVSARKIGTNYWLVGSEKGKGALLVLDESLREVQRMKALKVEAFADDENGALFVANAKLMWFKPDTSLVTVDLSAELDKNAVLKIIVTDSGSKAWLLTENAILHYDLVNQTLLNKLSWKAESWFSAKDNDINLTRLIHIGNNLFITKKSTPKYNELIGHYTEIAPVPLIAFDLTTNQQKWNATVLSNSLIAFDSAQVMVAKKVTEKDKDKETIFVALPYPAAKQ